MCSSTNNKKCICGLKIRTTAEAHYAGRQHKERIRNMASGLKSGKSDK